MTYHPAIELYDFATSNHGLASRLAATCSTLDKHYARGAFNMAAAKSLFRSNIKSAAREYVAAHGGERNVDDIRRTVRQDSVQDAAASILLYEYVKSKRGQCQPLF